MNEWVALESNKTYASNPIIGMVLVTTSYPSASPSDPNAYIQVGTNGFCTLPYNDATFPSLLYTLPNAPYCIGDIGHVLDPFESADSAGSGAVNTERRLVRDPGVVAEIDDLLQPSSC
jgi:hypothetical protein